MKKNPLIILLFILALSCSTQNTSHKDILTSTNITEIEEYLKNTHPEDPKKLILKSKLIALKNKEWTKGAATAKPMEPRLVITEIPQNFKKNFISNDSEEFKKLLAETPVEHKEKTIKLLNTMLNEDVSSKEVVLLFKNNSDCNLILKISGKKFYNMAVSAHSENFIVLNKDNYAISSNVCDVPYTSQKLINRNIQIALNNLEYKQPDKNLTLNSSATGRDKDNSIFTKKTNLAKQKKTKIKL